MLINQLAAKYARALFETAVEDGRLKEYQSLLGEIVSIINSQDDLKDFISHPLIKAEAKREVLQKILPDYAKEGAVYNFLMLLLDKRRESLLQGIYSQYEVLANEAQNIVSAEVTLAYDISERQEKLLSDKLSASTGKTVVITKKIDKSILGGVIVKMGDKCIDGSVMRQMQAMQSALMSAKS
jgi:F-type H+-transporting ATPase subunit delta